jgi:hypothetical protein
MNATVKDVMTTEVVAGSRLTLRSCMSLAACSAVSSGPTGGIPPNRDLGPWPATAR